MLQVIKFYNSRNASTQPFAPSSRFAPLRENCSRKGAKKYLRTLSVVIMLLIVPGLALAQNTSQPAPPPPAGTTTQQQQPGTLPPAPDRLPPNSSSAPVRPDNEAQQTVPGQQQPSATTPAGTQAPQAGQGTNPSNTQTGVQQTPGQNVGTSGGIAPAELPSDPPPVAPNFEAPERPLPSAERVGVDVSNQQPLSLNEAIALALSNNNDIDGSRINVEIAEYGLKSARGVYDPVISSESYYEDRITPTSSTLGGATNGAVNQKDLTGAARIGGFSPWGGGAYQLDFSSTRLTTNNQNATLNPQYPTALTFTYTQPLLRGLRFDNNRRQIEIAKKNLSLTDAQFRQRAIEVISQVEQAYWELAFALRNLQVQIDAVRQARIQVESNRRLVEKGVLAPIDIVAATTQVTTFEQNVYTAQEAVTRAENTLKTLILPDRTSPLWSRPLTPVTPVSLEAPRVPLEVAVTSALKNRPELAQLQTNAEINQIDTRYFRDQTKPQVDLVGTYTTVGLAGSLTQAGTGGGGGTNAALRTRVNELSTLAGLPLLETTTGGGTVTPNLVGGYTKSISNLIGQDYPSYRAGVRISLPLRNRTAEANLGSSLAEGRRIENQRAQAEQLIEADVRNSSQALRSAEARLASAAATRASAEQQYESEQRQFRAGTTTLFLVLQRQTELLAARGRELQAQTDLNKAIAEFQRATGNTLEANNVTTRQGTGGSSRELEIRGDSVSGKVSPINLFASPSTRTAEAGIISSGN